MPKKSGLSAIAIGLVVLAAVVPGAAAQDEASPDPAPTQAPGLRSSEAMPAVDGIEWLPIDEQSGIETEAEGAESAVAAWSTILSELGADFEDLTVEVHLAALEGTDLDHGVVLVARIAGAEAGDIRAAFANGLPRAMPFDAVISPTRLAGKDVLMVEVPPDYRFIYHYAGDIAYQLDLAPEIEESVLAALP